MIEGDAAKSLSESVEKIRVGSGTPRALRLKFNPSEFGFLVGTKIEMRREGELLLRVVAFA